MVLKGIIPYKFYCFFHCFPLPLRRHKEGPQVAFWKVKQGFSSCGGL